jgi:hypothetical protein
MDLFIPPNTFWRVEKLYSFRKNFLGTLGDALRDWPELFLFLKRSSKKNYA